ncbi:hypothetical protein FB471_5267 [Amycolatopsis cihanbeyliensis]|uniref:Uncharacterized protein n=1 Tax=Amycolatopsis cihanbeyliensis TaxID=1128664 RepID=A0A542DQU7_AMYCI|nr:hypothetical protein FB471_5267 [Amycolatopsis cihanbeyliensis]
MFVPCHNQHPSLVFVSTSSYVDNQWIGWVDDDRERNG